MGNGRLRDLVEHHALHRNLGLQLLQKMPANGFPLAVLVGGQIELGGILQEGLELFDNVFAAQRQLIGGFEIVVHINGKTLGRKVGNMAD